MRLATLPNGGRDGQLAVVSGDSTRHLPVHMSLQVALDDWAIVEPVLRGLGTRLVAGEGLPFDPSACLAPLPRAWQWLDGSAYPQHGALMQQGFKLPPIPTDKPLMYQGMSHRFLSARQDVPLPSEADGIDFEGEFAVVTGDVPMGCSAADALDHIRLVLLLNDWSLRTIAPVEMKTGFGWVQAKPACSVAPIAVTPDALGDGWRDGRVHATLTTTINGVPFGAVPAGDEMAYGFHELIAHAARTRDLPAGTMIGSGTVSSRDYEQVGSSCLSERRAIDAIMGRPLTPFLSFGDRVRMEASASGVAVFGRLDQRVVAG